MGKEGKNWRGLEPGDDVFITCDKTHASQRYLQAAVDLRANFQRLRTFSSLEEVYDVSIS